jgi:prophage antirepressor-like protein
MEANNILLFNYKGKEVRTFEINGIIWIISNDIAGISNHWDNNNTKKYLQPYEVGEVLINNPTGQNQIMVCISESGFYSMVFPNRKAEIYSIITSVIMATIKKTNSLNKRLRFLEMRFEENETAIYSAFRPNKPALQPENGEYQYSLF